jgi:hypothetical protein
MPRRHQVIISRLRMGYTNLTHGYRINDDIRPLCTDSNQEITVKHIMAMPELRREVGATYPERH